MLREHLEKLAAFKVVAEAGSIRKASQIIGIAQPALTRSMKVLEAAMGADLFKRSARGITLTREGELLLPYALTVLKGADDLQIQVKEGAGEIAGVLTIGTFSSLSMYLWPKLLAHLHKTWPHLQIRLKTQQENHIADLGRGLLDLVVDAEPRPYANMVSIPLYKDRFNFYAAKSHEIEPTPTFIFVPNSYDERDKTITDHFRENGWRDVLCPYELDSFETVKALTVQGIGIGVLPERVAAGAVESEELRRISLKPFPASGFGPHKICATIREEDRKDRRISAVIKEMKLLLA